MAAVALGAVSVAVLASGPALADLNPRAGVDGTGVESLTLHNIHTDETATIIFKRGGIYDADGLKALNTFLRDPLNNAPGNMDPHLFDLLRDVYQQTGSERTIEVLDGYRSPETNAYLRKTSDGVAENSLHMKGEAIDFYIPGVSLTLIRQIGLKEQAGGVGFYPDSSSPFIHLDTGGVRHWPLLSKQQLLAIFPDGKTLDIPADGDPLPGYSEALAAYKQREAALTPVTQVASFTPDGQPKGGLLSKFATAVAGKSATGTTPVVASAATPAAPSTTAQTAPAQSVGVAVASTQTAPVPKPNLAPRPPQTVVAALTPSSRQVATASVVGSLIPAPRPAPVVAPAPAAANARTASQSPHAADFASPDFWTAPAVPAALAVAMAGRDRAAAGSSVPIQPTAVVATVSVSRTLAADAMTSAVIRGQDKAGVVPVVLAYADASAAAPAPIRASAASSGKSPTSAAAVPAAQVRPSTALAALSQLTMTALDTASLRLWMGQSSTRQQSYALFTMPDATATPVLMSAATMVAPTTFAATPGTTLRTDRFAAVPAGSR